MHPFSFGHFVRSSECKLGIGKLMAFGEKQVAMEFFDSPTSPERPVVQVSRASVKRAKSEAQTRVYFVDPKSGNRRIARADSKTKFALEKLGFPKWRWEVDRVRYTPSRSWRREPTPVAISEGQTLSDALLEMMPGSKVFVSGFEQAGIGEIASLTSTKVTVRFYTNALAFKSLTIVTAMVRRAILPTQTRCYRRADGATRYGRVIGCQTETSPLATYLVQSGR